MNKSKLSEIFTSIEAEQRLFQEEFARALRSEVKLIDKIGEYILSQESKQIRPLLVMLTAQLCGQPNRRTTISACLVELLHTATLIHDDIVDQSDTRRGQPSVNALWHNQVAVLIGDYLFSKSLSYMIKLRDYNLLSLLSKTSELLSSGEILQIEKSYTRGMDEETYRQMIWAKTASLFATSCKMGAASVAAKPEKRCALYRYGKNVGMAFQMKDDLFDYTGDAERIGKPISRDVKSNILTLPLIHTLKKLPDLKRKRLKKLIRKGAKQEEVEEINAIVKENGGIVYTQECIGDLSLKAIQELASFPDSPAKNALIELVKYNQQRSK